MKDKHCVKLSLHTRHYWMKFSISSRLHTAIANIRTPARGWSSYCAAFSAMYHMLCVTCPNLCTEVLGLSIDVPQKMSLVCIMACYRTAHVSLHCVNLYYSYLGTKVSSAAKMFLEVERKNVPALDTTFDSKSKQVCCADVRMASGKRYMHETFSCLYLLLSINMLL